MCFPYLLYFGLVYFVTDLFMLLLDRSMFVVLDSLREEDSTVKSVTTNWLTHLLQRGDIGRVLDPLLNMLLHPDTAR